MLDEKEIRSLLPDYARGCVSEQDGKQIDEWICSSAAHRKEAEDCLNLEYLQSRIESIDNADTDADGLRDGDEATKYHTDPCNPDTDADGLRDGDEVNEYRTDPNNPDTDGDGVWDGAEILKHKTDPLNPATNAPATNAESADGAKEPAP